MVEAHAAPRGAAELAGLVGIVGARIADDVKAASGTVLRQRIEQVEALHSAAPIEQAGQGWRMFEDDGRIQISFDGKPAAELRQLCKGAGFVWSPSRCAWVRKVTVRAVNEARRLARALPAEG